MRLTHRVTILAMSSDVPQCTVLNLSDESRCPDEATNSNSLFCRLRAKQVIGLYLGYKRRNAKLNAMSAAPPKYLVEHESIPLRNQKFRDTEDLEVLNELHRYLFEKHNLFGRVVRARQLHHSRSTRWSWITGTSKT